MTPAAEGGVPMRQAGLSLQDGGILGCIDAIDGDRLFGWAWDPERPSARLPVEIYVDGARTARMDAAQLREVILGQDLGHGLSQPPPGGAVKIHVRGVVLGSGHEPHCVTCLTSTLGSGVRGPGRAVSCCNECREHVERLAATP